MKNFIRKIIQISVGSIALVNIALATTSVESTQIGRYLSVKNQALPAQQDLGDQILQIRFPANVVTVRDAVNFALQFSGYHLIENPDSSRGVNATLNQTLAAVDRLLGPMSLFILLQTLVGSTYYVVVDPINRLISFKIKPVYQSLYASQANYNLEDLDEANFSQNLV